MAVTSGWEQCLVPVICSEFIVDIYLELALLGQTARAFCSCIANIPA